MAEPTTPLLKVTQVKKAFKDIEAVKGISLVVQKGEFIALLGPNGAGKTTLVEMIEGIQQPSSGEIRIKGLTWSGNEKKLRRVIGLSLQETKFIEKTTHKETLIPWDTVKRLIYTRHHIFIQFSRIKYVIIPKRDFENEFEFSKYYCQLLKNKGNYI